MFEAFSEVASRYRAIFFDAYGVLKNSQGVLPGAPAVLAELREAGKQLFVLTNDASRPPAHMARGYVDPTHGQLISEDQLISSGLLATEFLRDKVRSGNAAYLGKPASAHFIEAAGLTPVPIAECCSHDVELSAIVMLDDEGFDWFQGLNLTVNVARRQNVPIVVANSDLAYPVGGDEVAVAIGSLANMLGGILRKTLIHCGKPDAMMFNYAFRQAQAQDPTLSKQDVLMVGDTLATDIIGANKFGFDSALVLSGTMLASRAPALIEASGIVPTHLCESIFT